jgi:enoyl-CoA hydratase/carnithine racemase
MANQVLIEERGPVTILKLNQPEKLNAWSRGMTAELSDYLSSLNEGEYTKRCLILTGEGRAFCSGADVGNLGASTQGQRPPWRPPHTDYHPADLLRRCDVPVIGAINGYSIGMGFGVALATDIRIAADDARFQVTQMKRGLFADGGLGHLLPQAVGDQRALEIMYTARMIEADEALELGLVLKVVPREELLDAALELAGQIAVSGPLGLAASKRVVYQRTDEPWQRSQEFTGLVIDRLFLTEDAKEGVQSFVERREPVFQGR